jgi:hypothetical protein
MRRASSRARLAAALCQHRGEEVWGVVWDSGRGRGGGPRGGGGIAGGVMEESASEGGRDAQLMYGGLEGKDGSGAGGGESGGAGGGGEEEGLNRGRDGGTDRERMEGGGVPRRQDDDVRVARAMAGGHRYRVEAFSVYVKRPETGKREARQEGRERIMLGERIR